MLKKRDFDWPVGPIGKYRNEETNKTIIITHIYRCLSTASRPYRSAESTIAELQLFGAKQH